MHFCSFRSSLIRHMCSGEFRLHIYFSYFVEAYSSYGKISISVIALHVLSGAVLLDKCSMGSLGYTSVLAIL